MIGTKILRPNGNKQTQWETSSYDRIDEPILTGENPDAYKNTISILEEPYNGTDQFDIEDIEIEDFTTKTITLHFFYQCHISSGGYANLRTRLYCGEDYVEINKSDETYGWVSISLEGIYTQAQINNAYIEFYGEVDGSGYVHLSVAYVEVEVEVSFENWVVIKLGEMDTKIDCAECPYLETV